MAKLKYQTLNTCLHQRVQTCSLIYTKGTDMFMFDTKGTDMFMFDTKGTDMFMFDTKGYRHVHV